MLEQVGRGQAMCHPIAVPLQDLAETRWANEAIVALALLFALSNQRIALRPARAERNAAPTSRPCSRHRTHAGSLEPAVQPRSHRPETCPHHPSTAATPAVVATWHAPLPVVSERARPSPGTGGSVPVIFALPTASTYPPDAARSPCCGTLGAHHPPPHQSTAPQHRTTARVTGTGDTDTSRRSLQRPMLDLVRLHQR